MTSFGRTFSFYFFMTLIYGFTVYNDYFMGIAFREAGLAQNAFGGRWKYLTFIDMNIQAAYFTLCFINIFLKLSLGRRKNQKSYLDSITNFLFTSLVFPIGLIVDVAFWGVYFFDRDLVYPKIMDTIVPEYQNHLVHTLPGVGVLLEMLIVKHNYNQCFFKGVIPTILFSSAYVIWVFVVNHYANIWVYPILAVLSSFYRAMFITFLLILASSFYWFGSFLNRKIWDSKSKLKKK